MGPSHSEGMSLNMWSNDDDDADVHHHPQVCLTSARLHHHEPPEHGEPGGAYQQGPGVPAAGPLPALQERQP